MAEPVISGRISTNNLIRKAMTQLYSTILFTVIGRLLNGGDFIQGDLANENDIEAVLTKLTVECIFRDYQKAYGLQFAVLRYFNAAGADPDCEIGESHDPETHIIPMVLDAADGQRDDIKVFGTDYDTPDGSCIRD